jgi:hypothetical protein
MESLSFNTEVILVAVYQNDTVVFSACVYCFKPGAVFFYVKTRSICDP